MLPDRFAIGSRLFHVRLLADDPVLSSDPDIRSYIDHSASLIVIRDEPGLSQDAREELLFHELVHAIVKNAGLDQCLRDGFSEEFLVSALAPRLHDFISQNFGFCS